MKAGMGRALRHVFRQDDLLARVTPRKPVRSSELMHPGRMALFARALQRPCSGVRQLAGHVGSSAPVAARHLARMERAGLVRGYRVANSKAFVPLDMVEPQDVRAFSVLSSGAERAALGHIVRSAAPNQRSLAKRLGTYQQEAALVVGRLAGAGLLEVRRSGREARYAPSSRLLEMAERYERLAPGFEARLVAALEADGLEPRVVRRKVRGTEVDRRQARAVMLFPTNPLCEVLI